MSALDSRMDVLPVRLKTLIVDDEPLARRGLELRLADAPDVEVVGQCANGAEAVKAIAEHEPDLMFLDVQMPGLDGFATLRAIPASQMPMVVFVTAYDHYAIRAFEASAVDYLLKPIDDSRLHQALYRVRQEFRERQAEQHLPRLLSLLGELSGKPALTLEQVIDGELPTPRAQQKLAIKDGSRIVRVDPATIRWVDAAGDYMCIHTETDTHILRATMRELEQQLDPRRFQRIHRSTIVNVDRVKEMRAHINGEYFLVLDSGHELKLSRTYKDKIALLR
jgi:two-component system LytT family response regulator